MDCCHSSVADDDYNVSSKNVTIPAHAREIKIPVETLRDYDGTEFIKATLNFIHQPPVKVNILPATAYIAIVDATGKAAAKYCVYSYVIYYGTCHKKLYKIRQFPQKICADYVNVRAAIRGIAVLLPWRVSSISSK